MLHATIILTFVSRGFAASNDKDVFVNCASDNSTYSCMLDGTCVPMQLHCDGKQDCEDGSDEGFCPRSCVGEDWFECKNGHCISVHWVCDGEDDCMDWTDEVDCKEDSKKVAKPFDAEKPEVTCPGTDFRCQDSLCIPVSWTCDDEEDCRHGDDEKLCGKEEHGCDGFSCGEDSCIPSRWVCDGEPDCADGLDEVDCGKERNGTEACKLDEGRFPVKTGHDAFCLSMCVTKYRSVKMGVTRILSVQRSLAAPPYPAHTNAYTHLRDLPVTARMATSSTRIRPTARTWTSARCLGHAARSVTTRKEVSPAPVRKGMFSAIIPAWLRLGNHSCSLQPRTR